LYATQFLRNCVAAKSRSVSPALAATDVYRYVLVYDTKISSLSRHFSVKYVLLSWFLYSVRTKYILRHIWEVRSRYVLGLKSTYQVHTLDKKYILKRSSTRWYDTIPQAEYVTVPSLYRYVPSTYYNSRFQMGVARFQMMYNISTGSRCRARPGYGIMPWSRNLPTHESRNRVGISGFSWATIRIQAAWNKIDTTLEQNAHLITVMGPMGCKN
jgi:hypothetical protein